MERVNFNIIEKIKNVVLVVLVLTTILLLYFLWGNASLEDFIFSDQDTHDEKIVAEDVIVPKEIIVCMGNDNYTVCNDELPEIISVFSSFSKQKNLLVKEISKDKYQEAMEYPSVRANFGYNIDFNDFCERYKIDMSLGFNNISTLTEIGFSKGSPESVFIYDGDKKKYFGIVYVGSGAKNNIAAFEDVITNKDNTTYYPLQTILGEESTNGTLIPIENTIDLQERPYEQDFKIDEIDTISSFAQTFFGESFDFVRNLEESNGTVIFMYGYGQKVLIVNPDGSIEYKEEQKNSDENELSFFSALDTSLNFVSMHGGFKTVSGRDIKPYLTEATPIAGEKNSYRFVFSFSVDGSKLYYAEKDPLIIEVVNGQVSYFRRDFIAVDEVAEKQKVKSQKDVFSAINTLALNSENIRDTLIGENLIEKEEQNQISFEQVANNIDNLYIGYYKPPADSETHHLIPAWIVEIKGVRLYMDLYDASWLGYSKQ